MASLGHTTESLVKAFALCVNIYWFQSLIQSFSMNKVSKYFSELQEKSPDVAARYTEKINLIDGIDPFALRDEDLSFSPESFPSVVQLDILTYLIVTTSYYTNQQMKAFKSLTAYKYFKSGFVRKFGTLKIRNNILVVGEVHHSQRLTQPPLHMWIICGEDGSINTAHCTCMAGAGEVCSHVAAVLFALEYVHSTRTNTSVTDVACQWNVPTFSHVEYAKIKNINLTKVAVPKPKTKIPPLQGKDLQDMLTKIKSAGSSAVIMRFIEPFASEIAAELENSSITYKGIFNIYKLEYESLSYDKLLDVAERTNFNLTQEDCSAITRATVGQSKSRQWLQERVGRITASKFKSVCHTKIEKPSLTLIKGICYENQFKSKYTEWGLKHEGDALADYQQLCTSRHENVQITSVGLCLDPDLPQFGATPDALIRCSCCGVGCVEVKCPYLLKEMDLQAFVNLKTSCLCKIGDIVALDKTHAYYYQVQCQMKMTDTRYCDFVIWSPKQLYYERVIFDEPFWTEKSAIAINFHRSVIMPELLGRYFTRNNQNTQAWCICEAFDDGKPMLRCENEDCHTKWFHLECVGLVDVPEDFWFCDECSPLLNM